MFYHLRPRTNDFCLQSNLKYEKNIYFKRKSAPEKQPQDINNLHKYNNILVIYLLISYIHVLENNFNRSFKINNNNLEICFLANFILKQL
jgi:hypothetical protein